MSLFPKKPPKATPPYMPAILKEIDAKHIPAAMQKLQDAAIDYFTRINAANATIPTADGAILIKLYRHIADEMARHDPVAAELAKTLEPIKLPPINYTTPKK
nr:hypothetical protein [uncultured Dysosmobacter sp.]